MSIAQTSNTFVSGLDLCRAICAHDVIYFDVVSNFYAYGLEDLQNYLTRDFSVLKVEVRGSQ